MNHFFSIATVATGQNVLMNSYRVKIYIYFQSVLFIPILDIYLFQLPTLETDKLKYRTLQTILLETRANAIWIREYKCWSRVRKRAVFLCWDHCVTVAVWVTPALARSGAGIALNRKMLI